jgi:hypothetical protein
MAPNEWQERVKEESRDLGVKLVKLEKFIASKEFEKTDPMERERLKAQFRVMRWYLEILADRIESFQ